MDNFLSFSRMLLGSALILMLVGCLPDFSNPIDPELSGSIPPTPTLAEVALIPYDDIVVHQGRFEYAYRNANGLLVERSVVGLDSFVVVDTVFPPERIFADPRPVLDTLQYQYRLVAFNGNGHSGSSAVLTPSATDTLDLFPPRMAVHYQGSPVAGFRMVSESPVALRLQIWDESPLAKLQWNSQSLTAPDSGKGWVNITDTLKSYTNRRIISATDASVQSRSSTDTVILYWDFPNRAPILEADTAGGKLNLRWAANRDPDFARWEIRVSTAGVPDTSVVPVVFEKGTDSLADAKKLGLTWPQERLFIRLSLRDSVGNLVHGNNSVVELRKGRIVRGGMIFVYPGSFINALGYSIAWGSGFYMDSTEVTQQSFLSFMGYNPSIFSGSTQPADAVSFLDAVRYCNARSKAEGFDTVYQYTRINGPLMEGLVVRNVTGYRLPYEDQWEYAARAGVNTSPYYWGEGVDYATASQYLWYSSNAGKDRSVLPYAINVGPQAVASRKPNAWGFYDMLGNLMEWTQNYWESQDARSGNRSNATGPLTCGSSCVVEDDLLYTQEERRAVRGGNWSLALSEAQLESRDALSQSVRMRDAGFRTVLGRLP